MGIIESEAASSAQLKGAEEIVADSKGTEVEIGTGIDSNSEMVSVIGSVCVDMVAEEVDGIITVLV